MEGKWGSFTEKAGMVALKEKLVVSLKEKVDVVYGESRGRLRRKWRSLTEEVGMVVVKGKLVVVVVHGESGCHLWRKWE